MTETAAVETALVTQLIIFQILDYNIRRMLYLQFKRVWKVHTNNIGQQMNVPLVALSNNLNKYVLLSRWYQVQHESIKCVNIWNIVCLIP